MIPTFVTADPRSSGLVRSVGSTALYITAGAIVPLFKYGTGNTDWCTVPQGGSATPVTADPRTGAGRDATTGTIVMYVTGGVGLLLRKYGSGVTEWATVPVISGGGGGSLTDGDKGDITVSGSGAAWAIDAGVVTTTKLGGDITTAGKAILDDATAADQRTTLGLGTAAVNSAASFEAAGNVAAHSSNVSGVHGISAFGATLTDDADAAAARTTLGLGTAATTASTAYAAAAHNHAASEITSGTVDTARLGSGTANATTFLRGDQTWAVPSGGGGSAAAGTFTANFGAFPGVHEVIVSVADAGIAAGSVVIANIRPQVTTDHSADEHYAEAPSFHVIPQSITAGVGFEVAIRYEPALREPLAFPGVGRKQGADGTAGRHTFGQPSIVPTIGGTVARTYGEWTFQWIRI